MFATESPRTDAFLRVLMVCPSQWRDDQGLPKVQMELTEELRRRGHVVEKFSPEDASAKYGLRRRVADVIPWFPSMVQRHLRERGGMYDVVDAHQGTITRPKEALGFSGGVVVRSAGLYYFYSAFNRWTDPHKRAGLRHWVGRRREVIARGVATHAVERSFDFADRIIIHNRAELDFLRSNPTWAAKTRMVPAPISKEAFEALSQSRRPSSCDNGARPVVTVVGTWDPRKGSRDWPQLARLLADAVPDVELRFLGTSLEKGEAVGAEALGEPVWVSRYGSRDLCELLYAGRAGAFPSYLEGSPIGIVEQLAAGIPVVAYDVPGPRDILQAVDPRLLVPPGDVVGMARRIVDVLALHRAEALHLRSRCLARAKELTWASWADTMVSYYAEAMDISRNRLASSRQDVGQRWPDQCGQRVGAYE